MKGNNQKGVTLLELTVVLLILIALAGLAIPYIGGTSRKVLCDATDVSMANIKKAIMDRYYLDTLGRFPQDLDGLTANATFASRDYNLHYLFSDRNIGGGRIHKSFDPDSATGWRSGGYLQSGFVLENDLTDNFSLSTFTDPLLADHIVAMDSWGRPIVIQVVTNANCIDSNEWGITTNEDFCARLVSAGSGSGVGLANGDIDTRILDNSATTTVKEQHRQNDDRILYLNVPTPAVDINPSCGD